MFIVNFKSIFIIFLVLSVPSTFGMEKKEKELSIFQAARYGYLGIVEKLLEGGIDVNATSYGVGVLQWAVFGGHSAIVELLLKKGAHINAMGDGGTALHWASYAGHFEVVQLLLKYGADIDRKGYQAQIKGKTALEIAKHYNLAAIVGLIEAEPLRRQKQEKEALDHACVMKVITQHAASVEIEFLLLMQRT